MISSSSPNSSITDRRSRIPRPGHIWVHIVISTRGTWLPGDQRGFRNSGHRIHSSGDYHNRPPLGEHSRLHEYFKQCAAPQVTIPHELRSAVGKAIIRSLARHGDRFLALAVGKTHAHLLAEVPDDWDAAKKLASRVKQASSRAIGTHIPGVVWSRGGATIRIENQPHQKKVFHYIVNHATKENAWVWEFRNPSQS